MSITTIDQALAISYSQFDIFCVIIMGILLYTTLIDVDRNNQQHLLMNVLVSVIIYSIVDAVWVFIYHNVLLPRTQLSRYLSNIFLYMTMTLCSYTIFCFLETCLDNISLSKVHGRHRIFVVFFAMSALIITTPWTHLLFSIDNAGNLSKGILYLPLMMLMYGHIIYSGIKAVFLALHPKNEAHKERYLTVAMYSVPAVIGAFIHYSFYNIPTLAIGFTVAMLVIYIFQIRDQVSLDALTGINNRKQGERFFIRRIKELNEESVPSLESLYLFMMDVNKFKVINDNYGHVEGDRALVTTAEALKEACCFIKSRCILSRFGGDEFVIGANLHSQEEADFLCEKINEMIEKKNKEAQPPYTISISTGYARYKKEYKSFKGFLAVADKLMYEKKHRYAKTILSR